MSTNDRKGTVLVIFPLPDGGREAGKVKEEDGGDNFPLIAETNGPVVQIVLFPELDIRHEILNYVDPSHPHRPSRRRRGFVQELEWGCERSDRRSC